VSKVCAITLHELSKATKLFWLVGLLFPVPGLIQSEDGLAATRKLDF